MRKFITRIFYLFIACIAIISCDNGENTPLDITITNEEELNQAFSAGETSGSIHFDAEDNWTASVSHLSRTEDNWVDINPKSGGAGKGQVITITMDENITGTERSATIIIVCGDTTITIAITQGCDANDGGNQNESIITKITAYGIKYSNTEKLKLYDTSFEYEGKQLVKATTKGECDIFGSNVTFETEYIYDSTNKKLNINSLEKYVYPGSTTPSIIDGTEIWDIKTNDKGYVVEALGKIYKDGILKSDVIDRFTYNNDGCLSTYYFFQDNHGEMEDQDDGPSNSTYYWNDGNLSEMRDDATQLAWMKMEYGEELNNGIFDLNQLMCDESYPIPDYTPIIMNMGKHSTNLQTKYNTYYQGEAEGEETIEEYLAIEISYEKDEKGRIKSIKYKHPDGKLNRPNYSETMLELNYND